MNLQGFLGEILPSQGNYFTVQIDKTGIVRQFIHKNLNEAVASIQAINNRNHNAYVATGSFLGKKRTQEKCHTKRAWYADIDCKQGGQYNTKKEARIAIGEALKNGLPPYSILIDSGNGYHLYWFCTEDVPRQLWKADAELLAKACAATKLKIDSAVTEDEARIMRAPDTLNYKDATHPKPCKVMLDTGVRYSSDDFTTEISAFRKPTTSHLNIDNSDLFSGLGSGQKLTSNAKQMIELCPVFNNSAVTHGEHDREPLWRSILHTLAYCEDGDQFIHPLSDGHPKYTPAKTDAKWFHSFANKENSGPVLCTTFNKESQLCNSCEWKGKIKSPISLGVGTPNDLPWPYRNGKTGVEKHDEDGWEPAIPYTIKLHDAVLDDTPGAETCYVSMTIGRRRIETTLPILIDQRACLNMLASHRVPFKIKEFYELHTLMVIWTHQLNQAKEGMANISHKFGWQKEGGFHYNNIIYSSKGKRRTKIHEPQLLKSFSPHGGLAPWQACANHVLNQPRQASWAIIASAFAAPLLKFTGVSGALLSIVSQDSGTGKSTSMKLAAGVWGNPKSTMASLDDTPNSVAHRLGILNTLPSYWDEVREKEQVQRFVTNVFRLAQGKEKARLNSSIQQRQTGEWDTMLVIASNDPLKDHILQTVGNSDAGVARVFELRAGHIAADGMSESDARHFYGHLDTNYGHAGEAYAEWVGQNPDKAKKIVQRLDSALSSKLNTTADERFWMATVASLLAGAQIATSLGICKFNIQEFTRYLVGKLLSMRTVKKEEYNTPLERSISMVSRYMHEKKEFIIRAKKMPHRGTNEILLDSDRHPAVIRIGTEDKTIRLLLDDFENWYYKTAGSGQSHIIDNLTHAGAKKLRGSIDAGTAGGIGGRFRCIDIPFNTPTFKTLAPA